MLRRIVQLLLLILFVSLLLLSTWRLPGDLAVNAFLKMDPLLSLQAAIASRSWVEGLGIGFMVLAASLVLGRFFCGWVCPMGATLEFGDQLIYGRRRRRIWKNDERRLRGLKYGILLLILLAALFGQSLAYLFDPISWMTRIFTYALWPMGIAIANIFLETGRPVFDEMGWMNLARADAGEPIFNGFGMLSVLFLIFLFWLNRYQPRFWCRHLCPLGALMALPARFTLMPRRVGSDCDLDGRCGLTCESGAIGADRQNYDASECVQCGRCVTDCHLKTTTFTPALFSEQRRGATDLNRRQALGWLAAGGLASSWLAFNPERLMVPRQALRPPGALEEDDFKATCIRCGQCIKACPTHCLQPASLETGVAGLMSPIAIMRLGPCDQNCNACGLVCPTGAIQAIHQAEKPWARIGFAVIQRERCVVWEQDRVCLVCDEHCPYGAIYWKEDPASKVRRPYIDEDRCNGCGQCENACPVEGPAAVRVWPEGRRPMERRA